MKNSHRDIFGHRGTSERRDIDERCDVADQQTFFRDSGVAWQTLDQMNVDII